MSTNIYWPVYKNLESEIVVLSYNIHIDDKQLDVYSTKISDLILRASAEIESISKELYKSNGGSKTTKIKYDDDAIAHLDSLWKLEQKVVIISSSNCFQTNRILQPFVKNETSTFHGKQTFSWNNSYQNLKHDRGNSLPFGSVKYLFDIMSALYVLNIYYKDESFELENDGKATSFPINLGSDLFSIKLHKHGGYDVNKGYLKKGDFDECIYFTKYTDEYYEKWRNDIIDTNKRLNEAAIKHPKFLEYVSKHGADAAVQAYSKSLYDIFTKEEWLNIIKSIPHNIQLYKGAQYEAILNKDNVH
ncbi:hypothetical protein [Bacteroides sp. 224]|uniref:hypothetical protein n=1 Tax=Bacteroides sp. 224 TaxID=2302936 RepID=UPI0013D7EDAC|nr:hypothetical protein [Bacteroides sp. 224]